MRRMLIDTQGLLSWIGVIVILSSGLIHFLNFFSEFQSAPYMGILFFIYFLGTVISAIGIFRHQLIWGWLLGAVLVSVAMSGYLVSRTVGFPFVGIEDWGPSQAYFSLVLEIIYFALFLGSDPMNITSKPVSHYSTGYFT